MEALAYPLDPELGGVGGHKNLGTKTNITIWQLVEFHCLIYVENQRATVIKLNILSTFQD